MSARIRSQSSSSTLLDSGNNNSSNNNNDLEGGSTFRSSGAVGGKRIVRARRCRKGCSLALVFKASKFRLHLRFRDEQTCDDWWAALRISKQLLLERAWSGAVSSGLLAAEDVNRASPLPPLKCVFVRCVRCVRCVCVWIGRHHHPARQTTPETTHTYTHTHTHLQYDTNRTTTVLLQGWTRSASTRRGARLSRRGYVRVRGGTNSYSWAHPRTHVCNTHAT